MTPPTAYSRTSPPTTTPTKPRPNRTSSAPCLQLLGWTDDLPQQTSSGGEDIPDLLLFADPQAKNRAGDRQTNSYLKAVADGRTRWGILTSRAVWRLYDQPVAQGLARCIPEAISVIRGHDGPSFGRYRTNDLILAYMNALAAGDTEARMAV